MDDAEGIDPEVLVAETGSEVDCVEEEAGQRGERDVVEVGADVGFCCLEGWRQGRAPAVTQGVIGSDYKAVRRGDINSRGAKVT